MGATCTCPSRCYGHRFCFNHHQRHPLPSLACTPSCQPSPCAQSLPFLRCQQVETTAVAYTATGPSAGGPLHGEPHEAAPAHGAAAGGDAATKALLRDPVVREVGIVQSACFLFDSQCAGPAGLVLRHVKRPACLPACWSACWSACVWPASASSGPNLTCAGIALMLHCSHLLMPRPRPCPIPLATLLPGAHLLVVLPWLRLRARCHGAVGGAGQCIACRGSAGLAHWECRGGLLGM